MARSTRTVWMIVLLASGVSMSVASAQSFVASVPTQISVAPKNVAPDSDSDDPVLSPNANLVVFKSGASNLVAGDTNEVTDIFVRGIDGAISRESVSSAGEQANQYSRDPAVSQTEPNGSFAIAFVSGATNLVPGLTNRDGEFSQVYLRLPHLKKTILISKGYQGSSLFAGAGQSQHPSVVSLDGGAKYLVAFHSDAFNLVQGASFSNPNGRRYKRIYFATVNPTTESVELRAFTGRDGVQADGDLVDPFLSGFGDSMVFRTDATNMGWMVPSTVSRAYQVVLARQGGAIELISKSPTDGTTGFETSESPAMSFNASRIVFKTAAPNIFGSSSTSPSIVAYDTNTKEYKLVNSTDANLRGNGVSYDMVRLDPQGRLAVFMDTSDNYTPAGVDTNKREDVFVKDLKTSKITRINLGVGGAQETDGYTGTPALGTLGYNSQTAAVGFFSSSTILRQVGDMQMRNVFRSLLTFPPPPLETTTKIESPPDVRPSAPKTLVLTLQKFDASTTTSALGSVDALSTKLSYDVRVTRTTTNKQRKVVSTKNRVTLRNLTPGQYTVKYRVTGKSNTGKKVRTDFSPSQTVTVTK